MSVLPFPPAPEPGWYEDERDVRPGDGADPMYDGTVRSGAVVHGNARSTYVLRNDSTGQCVVIDRSTLLGRKPSDLIPEGAQAVVLQDPTRTVSRSHAAITFDEDGSAWIEDYGSLNGTYIIRDHRESQVKKGTPLQIDAPAVLRIGDQFFSFEKSNNGNM